MKAPSLRNHALIIVGLFVTAVALFAAIAQIWSFGRAWNPSDAAIASLLSAGLVTAFAGFFYGRVHSLKIGGAEIDLDPPERLEVAQRVAKNAPSAATPDQVARATALSLEHATSRKRAKGRALRDQDFDDAVKGGWAWAAGR